MLNDPILLNDWHAVARVSAIRSGDVKPAHLLGIDLVLWNDSRQIHAWLDQCAHRGAKLSLGKVRGQSLVCPYHGWCYDASGTCTLVPAHPAETASFGAKARVYHVQIKYGLVWVCLGAPQQSVPVFPEGDDPSFRQVLAGPYRFKAYATRVLENFLDAGHYPFLHASHMASDTRYQMERYEVQSTSTGPAEKDISTRRIWREGPNGTGEVDVTYSYQVLRPLTAHYTKAYSSERFAMMDTVTPVDEAESLVWSIMALNYSTANFDQALLDYQDTLTGQDIPIVESQHPQLLPLNTEKPLEVHVPSDRLAVAYREWLKKIGLQYGTL
jgi:phenylpropionate dioxygenase-like ring-hydroxylating dioxygenase large terminal subunit